MRRIILAAWLAVVPATAAMADVRLSINLGGFPTLQAIPGYPVYYAPGVNTNYFFYDGLYWVFDGDTWYSSSWYNGPWRAVDPFAVPVYLLRVPVRYYRHPPAYFRSWRADAPPRWDQRWGRDWSDRHRGWDRWDRRHVERAAPLPTYQREYRGDRYPNDVQRQVELQQRNYSYRSPNGGTTAGNPQHITPREEREMNRNSPRGNRVDRHENSQERLNRERSQNGGGG
jgi:hypothetical protein